MTQNDNELTIAELARALGCGKATAANWPRAGMPLLKRGGRGRGNAATVSLRAACEWLVARPVWNENTFSMIAALDYQEQAGRILKRLNGR
jgi:phage terminase Nu1 subunit (DNA packaging protein)